MKYIFDQNLIKQLREGKIAINYGGSQMPDRLEKLNSLLKDAFPTCLSAEGNYSFYFYYKGLFLWKPSNETNLPHVLLDNFIFEPGDTLYGIYDNRPYFFVGFNNLENIIMHDHDTPKFLFPIEKRDMYRYSKVPPKNRLTKKEFSEKFGIDLNNYEITD